MDSEKTGLASSVFITRICVNVFRVDDFTGFFSGTYSTVVVQAAYPHTVPDFVPHIMCPAVQLNMHQRGSLLRNLVLIPPEFPLSTIQKYTHGIDRKNPCYNLKLPRQSMTNKQRLMCQQ